MSDMEGPTSLLFQDDFVFQRLDNSDEEEDAISPDVVDAIYAQMYFQPQTITTVRNHLTSGNQNTALNASQLPATEMAPAFNVSLIMESLDDSSKKRPQRTKRRKERKTKRVDKVSPPLQGAEVNTISSRSDLEHDQRSLNHDDTIAISSSDESGSLSDVSDGGSTIAESASSSERGVVDMALCSEDEEESWKISLKDKMGREAYERAYGGNKGRYCGQKCNNCKQKGHFMRNCPWPKRHQVCYLCAGLNHISSTCPCDLCSYCYQTRHKGRSCKSPWAKTNTQCSRCYMTGHHASICPDQWRQFHNTTYSSDAMFTVPGHLQRNPHKVFCFNCGLQGHYGFECTRTRPRGWPLPHLLLVARYDNFCWPPSNIHWLRQQDDCRAPPKRKNTPSNDWAASTSATQRDKWNSRDNRKGIPKHERSLSMDGGLLMSRDPPFQSKPLLQTPPSSRHVNRSHHFSSAERVHYNNYDHHLQRPLELPDLRLELNREHIDFPRTPLSLPSSSSSHMRSKRKRDYYEDADHYGNSHIVSPLVNHQRMDSHSPFLPHTPHDHDPLEKRYSDFSRNPPRPGYHHYTPYTPPHKRTRTNGEDYMLSARGFRGTAHTTASVPGHHHHHHRRNSSRY